jgi:acyl-coenzyme A synthetase/AMP-(fatty) acid ligase
MDELPRNANGKVLKRDLRKDVVEVVERQRAASAQEA